MKKYLIAGLVVVTVLTWTGPGIFETSLWTALAVMAACEAVVAAMLFASRWRNRRAAVVLAVLSAYQFGQSYFYEQAQYTSSDPVIPIDNFGVLVLSGIAISLIAAGPFPRDVTGAPPR
ncbi:hypothetical protein HQ325_16955 [Rhodococcus sp. BP-349]|uniref:hypothetical protein n=1 Tax=unclassified Rhodococcus (in: high G+C Gram-positive bacteria) TaxID=192944 RepID=UPI001C9AE367|nr:MULTISPECIES: hypothetical protein [unclassified Rhodococcus (in: high G+C Gram-positive bacteria)]MBY6540366.1 hypothetical protein [Rhodococcus sp. BP-363]MBY6545609.1 hypothetical protein [Rhodococcus sp. BP-369]MBY6564839.1 hypothetical protein [Rhodococcus sp. BP-370]MBY6578225.1 hypothetical protein [Rhodococcus sp. BP-364]MBY6587526.1 hypothetical protein [Rhodococcus sp. BP-358]